MSLQSTVGLAKIKPFKTLRTTVPKGIVAFLDLKPKDKLEWVMELSPTSVRYVTVRKVRGVHFPKV